MKERGKTGFGWGGGGGYADRKSMKAAGINHGSGLMNEFGESCEIKTEETEMER